jgi:hypothetical protein
MCLLQLVQQLFDALPSTSILPLHIVRPAPALNRSQPTHPKTPRLFDRTYTPIATLRDSA